MKLCLSSGSCSLEEAEMDTYNADPMHAGKNTAIEAGTKPWRHAGHREPVHSDWEIWGSLRQMHGSCSLSLGNKLTEGGPPLLPILVLTLNRLAPGPPLRPSNAPCVTQGICTRCVLCPERAILAPPLPTSFSKPRLKG